MIATSEFLLRCQVPWGARRVYRYAGDRNNPALSQLNPDVWATQHAPLCEVLDNFLPHDRTHARGA